VVLDVTATSDDGKKIFETSRIFMPQATDSRSNHMVLGPDKKLGLIRDTSIQPFAPKEETFEISVPPGVHTINVKTDLSYRPRPGNVYPIHSVVKTVELGQPD
jgi:hypothetical protein